MPVWEIHETTTYYDVYAASAETKEEAIGRHREGLSWKEPVSMSEAEIVEVIPLERKEVTQ